MKTIDPGERAVIQNSLLTWYRANRRALPWRGASPYAVWISEIMLQQTQVVTMTPYFLRFVAAFPNVHALAAAPLDAVLEQWAGLGYYARARNLHAAARLIVERYGGEIPESLSSILSLPGIGEYTAGAILSIAFNLPFPTVDGNVVRVYTRLAGIEGDPKSSETRAKIWRLANELLPAHCAGDFNQALMELGALICQPLEPSCEKCPALRHCCSGLSDDPTRFPELAPRRSSVKVTHSAIVIMNREGEVAIVRRPEHGLWGGLWEFPRVVCGTGEGPEEAAGRAARDVAGLSAVINRRFATVNHTVTHHRITLHGYIATLAMPSAGTAGDVNVRWERIENLEEFAFSAPQAKLRSALRSPDADATES